MENNLRTYEKSGVVESYISMGGLFKAEEALFERFAQKLSSASVLDIGIGAGRTTAWLSAKCREYTGIDYSESFVKHCRETFPSLKILHMDARDLSAFEDASFDLLNFSFNGIDYVNEEGREKIFKEMARVLKPGGLLLFSTHNLQHRDAGKQPWLVAGTPFMIRLKSLLKLMPYFPRMFRNKRSELRKKGFSILVDSAHHYSLLTFYTSPAYLRTQLQQQGFTGIQFYSAAGLPVADNQLDEWIYVSCLKTTF